MREIESLETFTLSKWDGNNEDGAGSLWVGAGNSRGLEMSSEEFSLKHHPSPSQLELAYSVGPGSLLGREREPLIISHIWSLLCASSSCDQEVEMRPDVGFFQNGAGSLASGGSGAWAWCSAVLFTVCPWVGL